MTEADAKPRILVLAGTNGAGKSSIAGAWLRQNGGVYFNPDDATRLIMKENDELSLDEANSMAWEKGKSLLEEAIRDRKNYAFETTLGGSTITRLLLKAATEGLDVQIWYISLDSPERHIKRVKARVARGGHHIPEERIRARFESSRENLVKLIPVLSKLSIYDNSFEADPANGTPPQPRLVLRMQHGRIVEPDAKHLKEIPHWAKPLAAAAMKSHLARGCGQQ